MNFINVESALQSLNRSEKYEHTLTRSLSELFFVNCSVFSAIERFNYDSTACEDSVH